MINDSFSLALAPTLEVANGSFGLLLARVAVGLGIAAHGAQKVLGWFGGGGPRGTGQFFENLGFRPGASFAVAAGLGELGGGLLLTLGLLGPFGPALIVTVMLVAILTVHRGNGFFAQNQGWELPLTYALAATLVMFAGPGRYALDPAVGLEGLWTPTKAWIALAAAVALAFANVAMRRKPAQPGAAEEAHFEERPRRTARRREPVTTR